MPVINCRAMLQSEREDKNIYLCVEPRHGRVCLADSHYQRSLHLTHLPSLRSYVLRADSATIFCLRCPIENQAASCKVGTSRSGSHFRYRIQFVKFVQIVKKLYGTANLCNGVSPKASPISTLSHKTHKRDAATHCFPIVCGKALIDLLGRTC